VAKFLELSPQTEWVQYGEPNDWEQSLAVYDGVDLMNGDEQEMPSLNRVMSLIDYDLAMKCVLATHPRHLPLLFIVLCGCLGPE